MKTYISELAESKPPAFSFCGTLRFVVTPLKPKLIVIVGPTASGKTGLSIELAKTFNGEVINADSRQVYKGLDIGTEKMQSKDMQGIKHHLLDVATPEEVYSSQRFKSDADKAIEDIRVRGKLPIVAGGTFFYIDTLLQKINAPAVAPDFSLRTELENKSTPELFAELASKDPKRAGTIDRHNKRRIMRALEILSVLPAVPELVVSESPYEVLTIGIQIDKKFLRDRLRTRAQNALDRGLIGETQNLLVQGVTKERLSEIGLEYKLVLEFLDGITSKEELLQKLEEKNWQYAKRQLMWLKRDPSINWFAREDTDAINSSVTRFLHT